ncbi:hypothetical protein HNQ36_004102 [Afipia massiliensis]|uniref:Uncharacterized protein n=1 Tax=Afipia massiliensis TaxID=211460 RepID=A0A840N4N5_9BRAD|nr:hypothetical protein [Afipia massiliensis]MBB5054100.1 hypothetical protein [Afipia massiliensis]
MAGIAAEARRGEISGIEQINMTKAGSDPGLLLLMQRTLSGVVDRPSLFGCTSRTDDSKIF